MSTSTYATLTGSFFRSLQTHNIFIAAEPETLCASSLINSSLASAPLTHDVHIAERHYLRCYHAGNTLLSIGPP